MRIVFLGTASGIPTKERNHPSIWVEYRGDVLLWDCGEGTQRQILKAGLNFMKIKHIFITHWHADHFAGILGLLESFNLERRDKPLKIFAPTASKFVDNLEELSYWDFGFEVSGVDLKYEGSEIEQIFSGENYSIYSIPTKHTVPSVGFSFKEVDSWNINPEKSKRRGLKPGPRMSELKEKGQIKVNEKLIKLEEVAKKRIGRKVVYSGDTKPCKNIEKLSKTADLLIHDGTFEEDLGTQHTSSEEAAKLAKRANVKQLILTHFSRRYKDLSSLLEQAEEVFTNTKLAKDFMEIEI